LEGDESMLLSRFAALAAAGAALAFLSIGSIRAADDPEPRDPAPRAKKDGDGPRAKVPRGERGRRSPEDARPDQPRDEGLDGSEPRRDPPPKPPRDGDLDRPPPGDEGDPPPKPPRGDGSDRPPPRAPGRLDPDNPSPGSPRGDRPQPPGAPRWPHDNWESLQQNDPEMYKLLKEDADLDRQERELAMQYRQAPTAQRDKIKKQIQGLVDKHFDVRQQRRLLELKRLEDELKRLRDSAERRTKARKELVERRVGELLGREGELPF
jgi:hypothetical protein